MESIDSTRISLSQSTKARMKFRKGSSRGGAEAQRSVFSFFLSLRALCLCEILFFSCFSVFGQNTISLAAEISRQEKLSAAAPSSRERCDAFLSLARLYQLSGNPEAVLKTYEAALAVSPGDGRILLEQGRFLISLGEYEKAGAAISTLLNGDREKSLVIQGQYLAALLEAFRTGNTGPLAALAVETEFAEFRSSIYYTLWKLTEIESYRTRLTAEFPQSPESKIAAGGVDSAASPLWLLFPGHWTEGRDSVVLSSPAAPAPVTAPVASAAPVSSPEAVSVRPSPAPVDKSEMLLQTGLFGREENAQAMAERLKKAGFAAQIFQRNVNNTGYWAVCVSGGTDMNAAIKKLKDAGFESFPVKQ